MSISNKSSLLRMQSFHYAWKGILHFMRSERHATVHAIAAVAAIITGAILEISNTEWLWIIASIGIVFTAEMFNTAIEKTVDLISTDFNKKAGVIKDIAAGAVLICAITSLLIGLIIFIPKLL
jgi:diacylglycerol kinase (ATP)